MQSATQQPDIKKQSRSRFIRGLAVFFFVCLAAALAGLFWFWGFLNRYEMQTPDAALREYSQLIKNRDFETIFQRGNFEVNELNDKDSYINTLQKLYTSGEDIKYLKKGVQGKEIIYSVYIDGAEAGSIQLYESGSKSGLALAARPLLEGNVHIKISAPKYAKIYLDGQELEQSFIVEEIPHKAFKGAPEELIPKTAVYEVKNLLSMPEITADANGRSCVVLQENGEFKIVPAISGIDVPEYEQLITKTAKVYANFVSRDAPRSDILALAMPNTSFAKSMQNFSNMWYIDHDTFAFENLQVKDIVEHSETSFSGYISFDYIVKRGAKTNTFPAKYYMMFLKENGKWKLYDLHTL